MEKKILGYIVLFLYLFLTNINFNVYAAAPSCYKCTQGASTWYDYDYNIQNDAIKNFCTKVNNSNCSSTSTSNESTCIYKDENGNKITYVLNHDSKTVSNPPTLSYQTQCFQYIENRLPEYSSFIPEGSTNGVATCEKFETIYANVPSSYSSCSIDVQSWGSANKFTLDKNASSGTPNYNSKYCLYELSSNKEYFQLKSEGIRFTGEYDLYTELMITVNLDNEKITTNNIETVLPDGTRIDKEFKFSDLIDEYNKCTNKLYWNDNLGSPSIDNEDYSNNGDGDSSINFGDPVEVNCEGILGQELIDFLNKIFRWIQILAPIFVIIISGVDFAGAILQDDKDAMKKASSKFIKRLIIAVALFFIPIILSWLLNIFNDISGAASSTCGIGE